MNHREELNVDEGLRGNEQIEEAIVALQQNRRRKCWHIP